MTGISSTSSSPINNAVLNQTIAGRQQQDQDQDQITQLSPSHSIVTPGALRLNAALSHVQSLVNRDGSASGMPSVAIVHRRLAVPGDFMGLNNVWSIYKRHLLNDVSARDVVSLSRVNKASRFMVEQFLKPYVPRSVQELINENSRETTRFLLRGQQIPSIRPRHEHKVHFPETQSLGKVLNASTNMARVDMAELDWAIKVVAEVAHGRPNEADSIRRGLLNLAAFQPAVVIHAGNERNLELPGAFFSAFTHSSRDVQILAWELLSQWGRNQIPPLNHADISEMKKYSNVMETKNENGKQTEVPTRKQVELPPRALVSSEEHKKLLIGWMSNLSEIQHVPQAMIATYVRVATEFIEYVERHGELRELNQLDAALSSYLIYRGPTRVYETTYAPGRLPLDLFKDYAKHSEIIGT
jgi:hypothetical protein